MNKKILIGIVIGVLLLGVIGFSYSFFTTSIIGTGQENTVTAGTLKLTYRDGQAITLSNAKPGDFVTKTFTVSNTGTLDTSYSIIYKNIINEITKNELEVSYTCTSYKDYIDSNNKGTVSGTCNSLSNQVVPYSITSADKFLSGDILIPSSITHEYNITFTFKEINDNQNYNQNKYFYTLLNVVDYFEQLNTEYEINYYTDFNQALSVISNNNYDDESIKTTKDNASVALYIDENDIPNLLILEDLNFNNSIDITNDVILQLGGKVLNFNSDTAFNVESDNFVIDGTKEGSKISLTNANQKTTLAEINNGSLTLNGGTYETTSNGVGTDSNPNSSFVVGDTATLSVNNASIISNDTGGGTLVGVLVEDGATTNISNSSIEVTSLNGLKSDGIRNNGVMTLTNTNVVAYSNYTANAAKNDYATSTRGISNEGIMTLKNCYVYGAHSGIRSLGTLYIDGGTYEGYGHGGIYFGGSNTTSYVKNAKVSLVDIKIGFDDGIAGTNKAGFYIGGASNVVVYMDNCNLYGSYYPAVLRSSGNERNNALYISNSIAENYDRYFRNDGSTNKIYIGTGNNFTIYNTYKESGTVETTDDYGLLFPNY